MIVPYAMGRKDQEDALSIRRKQLEISQLKKYTDCVVQDKDIVMNKRKIRRMIENELLPKKDDIILEIGCNRGDMVKYFQGLSPQTYGIDLNLQAIHHRVSDKMAFMDATNLAYADASFNKIYSIHAIEHIIDAPRLFAEMERVLKPGGIIVVAYPFELFRGMAALRTAKQAYGSFFKARDLHVIKYNPAKIKKTIAGTRLVHKMSRFFFGNTPQYLSVITKEDGSENPAHGSK